jgi:RHS repeat-associated protein
MLRRLLTLLTVLTLACASAHAYVPERSLLQAGELASQAKTAPRGFAARAEPAAKEKSGASDCCIRENWHPPLKLASSMQFTGHYREREGSSYYAQQRYYRPNLGRFNRVDPWEGDPLRPVTLNKYLYANGNPLAYIDPDGRQAIGETLADRHFMEVAASGHYSQEEIQALARHKMEIEAELSAEATPYLALAVPGTLMAKGLWSVGRATFGAYRAGGAYHAANVAAVEGAALTESAILTGVGVATGAEVPSVMSAPLTASRRLVQTAGGLDASFDALQPLQRVANQSELPMPQASLLSSSAAANRVQRAQPVTVGEGADGGSVLLALPPPRTAGEWRRTPGIVTGGSKAVDTDGTDWFAGSHGNLARIPRQAADRLAGREFSTFDDFRSEFWTTVAETPELAAQFSSRNVARMLEGNAPFAPTSQALPGQRTYQLHHRTPISQGGPVYDLDNLLITTPRYHREVLDATYHSGR